MGCVADMSLATMGCGHGAFGCQSLDRGTGRCVRIRAQFHVFRRSVCQTGKGHRQQQQQEQDRWETYDLKPNDYFYPERDVADGRLAPESVKNRLIDEFPDKVRVTIDQKEELVAQIAHDTKILQDNNAVDYSLFLVRYPASLSGADNGKIPPPPGKGSQWRTGMVSRDGKWIYRAILLDFFWSKDALQAHAMTGLVNTYNFVKLGRNHGPMSITTSSDEYRTRFLRMIEEMVEVPDSTGQPAGQVRSPPPGEADSDSV